MDTFYVKLTVQDSGLNSDSETKTYVYDEYPECLGGVGGGGPSVPTMAEKYDEPKGEVTVTNISSSYTDGKCKCEKLIRVIKITHTTLNEFTKEDMNFSIALRDKVVRMENRNREIEEKTKELISLVHNPDDDLKEKKK